MEDNYFTILGWFLPQNCYRTPTFWDLGQSGFEKKYISLTTERKHIKTTNLLKFFSPIRITFTDEVSQTKFCVRSRQCPAWLLGLTSKTDCALLQFVPVYLCMFRHVFSDLLCGISVVFLASTSSKQNSKRLSCFVVLLVSFTAYAHPAAFLLS